MNLRKLSPIVLVLVVALSAGVVSAQDTTDKATVPPPPPRPYAPYHYYPYTETVTVYPAQVNILRHIMQTIGDSLGLTRAQVNDYRLSMTFVELVSLYGGDESYVRSAVMVDLRTWVDEGVANGTISAARGALILNNLPQIVERAFSGYFNVNGTTVTGLLLDA
jgi:hypothetical protein